MDLLEKLKKIMETEYGIKTDFDLMKAVEETPGVDLGIFVSPLTKDMSHAT